MATRCIICGRPFKDGEGRYINVCVPCFDDGRKPVFGREEINELRI